MKPASERPQLSRLPFRALGAVAKVIESGDRKYAEGDWITAPERIDGRRDIDSALAHLAEWLGGKDVDEESGESPLAHAAARLLFILERESIGIHAGRWRSGPKPLDGAISSGRRCRYRWVDDIGEEHVCELFKDHKWAHVCGSAEFHPSFVDASAAPFPRCPHVGRNPSEGRWFLCSRRSGHGGEHRFTIPYSAAESGL